MAGCTDCSFFSSRMFCFWFHKYIYIIPLFCVFCLFLKLFFVLFLFLFFFVLFELFFLCFSPFLLLLLFVLRRNADYKAQLNVKKRRGKRRTLSVCSYNDVSTNVNQDDGFALFFFFEGGGFGVLGPV